MLPPPQLSGPPENQILAALNAADYQHFLSQLERITFSLGEVVYEPGDKIDHVYFPVTAVFSMLCTMEDGDTAEIGPVGREGLAGLNIFFGSNISPTRLVAHVAGTALRIDAELFRRELRSERSVMPRLLFRYTRMLLAMTGQSSACNKLHTLEQQLGRWLLTMHDYVSDELLLTHELIALTLGVRRAGISGSAADFKNEGLIAYNRGHIRILNRQGLEAKACECYRVIRDEYDRLYTDLAKTAK